jgi:hypothetical protein
MTPLPVQEVLRRLSALGARVECKEGKVVLRTGDQPVPHELIAAARACKTELATAIDRPAAKPLAPDWWRDEYEERAAIREFGGRYTRAQAERLAWGELENRWHSQHGERVPPDICAGCRRPIGNSRALDVADGTRVHDIDCLIKFGERWRGAATRALIEMGLTPPQKEEGAK